MATIEIIQVVVVDSVIGKGVEKNPYRTITEYFMMNGEKLFSVDSYAEIQKRERDQLCDQLGRGE